MRYLFPFAGVKVELFARDENSQAPLEAIFSLPGFADDVKAAISDRGCPVPVLNVEVAVNLAEAPPAPYRIAYQRSAAPAARPRRPDPVPV